MHLYEIKAASLARKLKEQSAVDIDSKLEKSAAEVGQASALGGGDETAAGIGMGDNLGAGEFGAAPDPLAGQSPLQAQGDLAADDPLGTDTTDDEQDEMLMQKVDSILLTAVKGHGYAKNYRHQDNSKIHPYKILGMQMDELNQLRLMARNKANMETFDGELGAYDNPDISFFQDLVSYVDQVIDVKKSSTREHTDKKEGKTAKFDKQADAKTKPGKAKVKKSKS